MKKNFYLKKFLESIFKDNRKRGILFLTMLCITGLVNSQTVTVSGTQNNIPISKVNLSVNNTLIEQTSPTGNANPDPGDQPVLISSVLLENGKEIFVTSRIPEISNPNPVIGTDQIEDYKVEIFSPNLANINHRNPEFLNSLTEVVSTPDLRSYWSIGNQPSIPNGETFVELKYPFPNSGYILVSERNGNSSIEFIALGMNGKPIPGSSKVHVGGYQWDTGVNHAIDNPTQKQWLVVFSPSLFNTLQPIAGVRVVSINEPDGKLIFFVGSLSATPDYAGPISNLTESKAVINIFENDELNEAIVRPFDVNLSVITPFPDNTLILNPDGTVDVPANTPPGTYTMTYQITDKVGGESDQTTVTVRVFEMMPEANDDNGSLVIPEEAKALLNVLENDLVNGLQATLENVILTETANNTNGILTLNPDGTVDVSGGSVPGVYQLTYQICDRSASTKCNSAIVKIYLAVSEILAEDDDFGSYTQTGTLGNILLNDKINGIPVGPNQVNVVMTDSNGLQDLIVEPNGVLRLPSRIAPGQYILQYELSEKDNPSNKDQAEIRFEVKNSAISIINDQGRTNQNESVELDVLSNDQSASGAFNLEQLQITVQPANGTVSVNEDGTMTYSPSTNFNGQDRFTYSICDSQDAGACDAATVTIQVNPILLELVKTVDKQRVGIGELITYTLTLTNNSEFELEEIIMEDPLPEVLQFISSSPAPTAESIWNIGSLAPAESISMTIEAMALESGEATNIATVTIGEYQTSDESETVTISSQVDMKIVKSSLQEEIFQGNDFTYEIQVTNAGDSDAMEVVISDVLPTGLSYVSTSHSSTLDGMEVVSAVNGQNLSWTVANFPAGITLTISLSVRADQIGTIINQAEVNTLEQEELTPEDNMDQDINEVVGFFIPNVFTPTSKDNKNDQFVIKGIQQFSTNKLVIFNRWGDHVFEATNYNNTWDAEGLGAGPYFYVLEVTDSSDKKQTFQGWIQVIKD
jgi:uncharacterized repeat protein (TIGR01451 family)/gliding motility-associated-like protein